MSRFTFGSCLLWMSCAAIMVVYYQPRRVICLSCPAPVPQGGVPVLRSSYYEYGLVTDFLMVGESTQTSFRIKWFELSIELLFLTSIFLILAGCLRLYRYWTHVQSEIRRVEALIAQDESTIMSMDTR